MTSPPASPASSHKASLSSVPLRRQASIFRKAMKIKPVFQTVLATQMPLLAFAGARIEVLELDRAEVRLPYGWKSKNIFGTMYFGAILMAAESACGSIVLLHNQNSPYEFSPIVKRVEADFIKAAKSDIIFRCTEGQVAMDLFERALRSGERVEEFMEVVGSTEEDGEVARVRVLWSARFKKK